MSFRDEIIRSKKVDQFELADNIDELMVSNRTGPNHDIMGKNHWMKLYRPLPATSSYRLPNRT